MNNLKTTWGIIIKAFVIALFIVAAKLLFNYLGFEMISLSPVITALVAGVFFIIAIILSGVLNDFKESEKIPGDLAASIEALYKDSLLCGAKDPDVLVFENLRDLMKAIISNIKQEGRWKASEINIHMDKIDDYVRELAVRGVAPAFIVKMRNELVNVKRITNRIEIIKETSFLPAGQSIAKFAIASALSVMLLLNFEPYYEGLILIGIISLIFSSILLLILDMDEPFEGYVQVDLKQLYKLQAYLDTRK